MAGKKVISPWLEMKSILFCAVTGWTEYFALTEYCDWPERLIVMPGFLFSKLDPVEEANCTLGTGSSSMMVKVKMVVVPVVL